MKWYCGNCDEQTEEEIIKNDKRCSKCKYDYPINTY